MQPIRILAILVFFLLVCGLATGCGSSDDDARTSPAASETGDDESEPTTTTEDEEDLVVVPGTGIAGVRIGDEEEAVIEALGEPDRRTEMPNEFSGGTNTRMEWDSPAIAAIVAPIPATGGQPATSEVTQVETTDELVRTANGLGVGDAQSVVVSGHPEVVCDTGALHTCRIGPEQAGSIVTDFIIKDDAVTRIVVGRIVD